MVELTQAAQQRLDEYLTDLRLTLSECGSVDPNEVERDVRDHIQAARTLATLFPELSQEQRRELSPSGRAAILIEKFVVGTVRVAPRDDYGAAPGRVSQPEEVIEGEARVIS